ncbi:DNA repair and recombination protein RadB [archaeon]|jgi:DNA repair protein RadB|nr:DNA repair and recombination protein RadB [archaeon]MBT4241889.1 DNA repair and recombination protein RadB [archaeon]MBT4418436.1 DNA repair and recombination protein RadB [archaeon]
MEIGLKEEAMIEDNLNDKVMTGSYDLNKWLEGGYEKGVISLFYGGPASGKSNFVVLAACHQAKKNKKVLFIDSEGSLSLDRVKQISGGLPEMILKNICILKPVNFKEQKDAFSKLFKELKKSENIGLIVVDSISLLYRLELAEARKKGIDEVRRINFDLIEQIKYLQEIARKRNIAVLVTTQVYNEFLSEEDWLAGKEAGVNVVGGDILKYWSKCLIELKNNGKRQAIIRKHRSLPEKSLNFEICNEGIRKKGWL